MADMGRWIWRRRLADVQRSADLISPTRIFAWFILECGKVLRALLKFGRDISQIEDALSYESD